MIDSPSEGERERYAVPASLDAAGEIDPGFRPSEGTPPYGSSPFTKENVRNPAGRALICAANHARKRQRHTKKESVEATSTLSFVLDARPQGVAAQRKVGESQEGIGNLGVLSPFAPPPPGGARPCTPQRASPHRRVAAEPPHGFNPYRMPQIPYTPYKDQASRCTRRVRAWKGPEHRRPRCQYCGLRDTSRPYRHRPGRRGRADRSAR